MACCGALPGIRLTIGAHSGRDRENKPTDTKDSYGEPAVKAEYLREAAGKAPDPPIGLDCMFEVAKAQVAATAEKAAHLRRFL